MVLEYVSLIANHLTQKESVARKTAAKENCIKDTLKN